MDDNEITGTGIVNAVVASAVQTWLAEAGKLNWFHDGAFPPRAPDDGFEAIDRTLLDVLTAEGVIPADYRESAWIEHGSVEFDLVQIHVHGDWLNVGSNGAHLYQRDFDL